MTKEEFRNILANAYNGYISYDEHTMDNSAILYTDNLNQFNEYCKDNSETFLGFCSAPYKKEIYMDEKHSLVLDMAMVFEYTGSFEKKLVSY